MKRGAPYQKCTRAYLFVSFEKEGWPWIIMCLSTWCSIVYVIVRDCLIGPVDQHGFFFVCVRHSFISISSSPNAMICGEVNEQHLILGIYFICISYDVLSLKSEWLASHHVYQQMMTNYVNLYYSCFFRHNSSSVLDIAYEPYAPNARSHHLCPGCCYSTHRYSSFYSWISTFNPIRNREPSAKRSTERQKQQNKRRSLIRDRNVFWPKKTPVDANKFIKQN